MTYFYSVFARLIDKRQLSAGFAEDMQRLSGRDISSDIVLPMERALREARHSSGRLAHGHSSMLMTDSHVRPKPGLGE